MSDVHQHLDAWLAEDGCALLVTIGAVAGSSPREAGTQLAVRADGRFTGTIGGGALEWQALGEAQKLLRPDAPALVEKTVILGPDLGQCCGGRVTLRFERLTQADRARLPTLFAPERRMPVLLFGAGHVGRALVLALAPLPFDLHWIDPRRNEFPAVFPSNVTPVSPDDPVFEIAHAPHDAAILVLTHSHALDLALCDAAMRRPDFPLIGVIGSQTKRARFVSQLRQMGHDDKTLARLTCPIGLPELGSKAPAVIAAGVAVQLLQLKARQASDLWSAKDKLDACQSAR
jgi:xanthine dehydrogenase accessory factor